MELEEAEQEFLLELQEAEQEFLLELQQAEQEFLMELQQAEQEFLMELEQAEQEFLMELEEAEQEFLMELQQAELLWKHRETQGPNNQSLAKAAQFAISCSQPPNPRCQHTSKGLEGVGLEKRFSPSPGLTESPELEGTQEGLWRIPEDAGISRACGQSSLRIQGVQISSDSSQEPKEVSQARLDMAGNSLG
ncbi:hypothetical protein TURU_064966 [Turdus rufiventris]|nr:hypothetical protein TURU_064966 [Turdus rufiventris]